MNDSILTTVKKMLGIDPDYTAFDADIIALINMAITIAKQFGINSSTNIIVQDSTAKWSDLTDSVQIANLLRLYVYLKVKSTFDPPSTSFVIQAYNKQIEQIEWRMNLALQEEGDE